MRILPFVLLAGCSAEPAVSTTVQHAKCLPYQCGENSPEAEGNLFWEQNENGLPNDEGIYIDTFEAVVAGVPQVLHPDVRDGQLIALDPATNAIVLQGLDLIDAKFTLRDNVTNNTFYVTVEEARLIPMWAHAPIANAQTWSYRLHYWSSTVPNGKNLCKAAGTATGDMMDPFFAVLFDDDRIDPNAKTVYSQDPGWFTIGCAGSALAKLHLSSHTKAGSTLVGRTTTLSQRTAFLKMLVADYCGTGDAFTAAGTELNYRDAQGYMNIANDGEEVEALWTSAGAICVGIPRVHYSPTTPLSPLGSSILDELRQSGCSLPPPCTPAFYGARYPFGQAHAMSTNY